MQDRSELPDDIPVADAVEQDQEITPEPQTVEPVDAPIEADPADWQDQHQEVAGDAADDER